MMIDRQTDSDTPQPKVQQLANEKAMAMCNRVSQVSCQELAVSYQISAVSKSAAAEMYCANSALCRRVVPCHLAA